MPTFAPPQVVNSSPPPRRPGRRKSPSGAISLLVALVLIVGSLWAKSHWLTSAGAPSTVAGIPIVPLDDVHGSLTTASVGGSARASWPPVPRDAARQPLGHPPAQSSQSTTYMFMETIGRSGKPVRWDPCRPIHVVVNDTMAPAGSAGLVENALARVSHATGLRFVMEGRTNEPPGTGRQQADPIRYGDRWAPVLVAWTDPNHVTELGGRVAGLGGPVSAPFGTEDEKHWVSGLVYLDAPAFTNILTRPEGHAQAQAIVMHEVAHLVGLTHVSASSELMYSDNVGQTDFGPGDLEGLRGLGDGPCFT